MLSATVDFDKLIDSTAREAGTEDRMLYTHVPVVLFIWWLLVCVFVSLCIDAHDVHDVSSAKVTGKGIQVLASLKR